MSIYVWPQSTPRYIPYMSDFLNGTHYVLEERDRAWWKKEELRIGSSYAQCDAIFFSSSKEERESSDAHTKKTLTSRRDDRDMFTKGKKKNVGKLQACKSRRRYRWQIETCISIELTLFFLHQFSLFFSSFNCRISLTDECLSDFFVFMK